MRYISSQDGALQSRTASILSSSNNILFTSLDIQSRYIREANLTVVARRVMFILSKSHDRDNLLTIVSKFYFKLLLYINSNFIEVSN